MCVCGSVVSLIRRPLARRPSESLLYSYAGRHHDDGDDDDDALMPLFITSRGAKTVCLQYVQARALVCSEH